MNSRFRIAILGAVLGALASPATITPVFAQGADLTPGSGVAIGPAPARPAPGRPANAPTNSPLGDASGKRAMERVEQHINDLHKRLAITPAQQTQWASFAEVMRQNARRMEASYADRQGRTATTTAVEDLRAYAAMERARAEDVERLVPAFDTLYQAMSPEQRASADKTFHDFQRGPRGKNRA